MKILLTFRSLYLLYFFIIFGLLIVKICFILVEIRYWRMMILNLTIFPLNSVPKIPFLSKFGPETSKCFVLDETLYNQVLKGVGVDSEFNSCCPKNTPFRQIWFTIFRVLCLKWKPAHMLIRNLIIVFLNSVPKIPFFGVNYILKPELAWL